jgi:hypothetical protein
MIENASHQQELIAFNITYCIQVLCDGIGRDFGGLSIRKLDIISPGVEYGAAVALPGDTVPSSDHFCPNAMTLAIDTLSPISMVTIAPMY